MSFPLARLAKGHGKADKGNSCEALCLPGLRHALRVRMRTFFRGRSATVRLCVCVSKISGTAKYKALKVARKLLFPRRPLLPPLIFSFAVIIHTVNCSLLTRDYRFRGKVRQNLLKMQIFYREIPQKRISLFPIPYFVSKLYGIIRSDGWPYSQPIGRCIPNRLGTVLPAVGTSVPNRLEIVLLGQGCGLTCCRLLASLHRPWCKPCIANFTSHPTKPTSKAVNKIAFRTNFHDKPVLIRLKKRNFASKIKV